MRMPKFATDDRLRESQVEARLVRDVHRAKGRCYKWKSANNNGVADRICFFPNRVIGIAECKRPGEELSPLQADTARVLAIFGVRVWIIDSYEDVTEFVRYHVELASL